jgi:hypothetical protein
MAVASRTGFEDQEGPYKYRCSVKEYGEGVYTLNLSDQAGSSSASALQLPHALAVWLQQNQNLAVVSVTLLTDKHDTVTVGRLMVVTRSK